MVQPGAVCLGNGKCPSQGLKIDFVAPYEVFQTRTADSGDV